MYKTNFMMMEYNSVKRYNQSKDCEKSLEKNEQEVLVLPPNLLQELGINLGNIRNTSDYPVDKGDVELTNLQSEEKSKNKFDQLDTVVKEVTGHVWETSIQLGPTTLSCNNIPQQKQEHIIVNNVTWTSSIAQNNTNINIDLKIDENTVNQISPQQVVKHGSTETFNKLEIFATPKNALTPFKINTLLEKPTNTTIADNITSEHSISLEHEFGRSQMLQTEDFGCTMHTEENYSNINNINNYSDIDVADGLVPDTNKELHDSDFNSVETKDNLAREESEIDCATNEVHDLREESNLVSSTENISVKTPTPSTSLISQMSADNPLTDVYRIEIVEIDEDDEIGNEKNNNISEMVDECNISGSDKQYMGVSRSNSVTQNPDYVNESLLEKVNLSPHHLTTTSKLCIQGVEKPGGIIESDQLQTKKMIFRTYQNRKAKNGFKKRISDETIVKELAARTSAMTDECTYVNNNLTCVNKPICTHFDFGRLQYDDNENKCGSLHSLPKNTEQSTPLRMFETFSEEHSSDEDIFLETDSNYGNNDTQLNDSSNIFCKGLSISETDIPEEFNEEQTALWNETYGNIYDENMHLTDIDHADYIGSNDSYSPSPEVKMVDICNNGTLSKQKRKRTFTEDEGTSLQNIEVNNRNAPDVKKLSSSVKCAVCNKEIPEVDWDSHLYENHCHIGWKKGSSIIDLNDKELIQKLSKTLKKVHSLYCTFCGKKERDLIKMLAHLKICIMKIFMNTNITNTNCSEEDVKIINGDSDIKSELVKCGVCKEELCSTDWNVHIQKHNYLAWKDGDPEFNLDDEKNIHNYLQNILMDIGELVCGKCGVVHHNPKSFIKHIKYCNENKINNSHNDSVVVNQSKDDVNQTQDENTSLTLSGSVECGVCAQEVAGTEWLDHIHKKHNYLAKIRGVPPLDLEDDDAIWKHLHGIRSITGRLICAKCGRKQKIIKKFLKHIKECDGTTINLVEKFEDTITGTFSNQHRRIRTAEEVAEKSEACTTKKRKRTFTEEEETSLQSIEAINRNVQDVKKLSSSVKCAVCNKEIPEVDWDSHLYENHCHIGWKKGSSIIDLNDKELIQKLSKTLKKVHNLYCTFCGKKEKDLKKMLAHLKICITEIFTNVNVINTNCSEEEVKIDNKDSVKCEICKEDVPVIQWTEHMSTRHVVTKTQIEIISNPIENVIKVEHADEKEIKSELVKCGVCKEELSSTDWNVHIQKHNYLAWKNGDPELNVDDGRNTYNHLQNILNDIGELVCGKCDAVRHYPRSFIKHIQKCKGKTINKSHNDSVVDQSKDDVNQSQDENTSLTVSSSVECGVLISCQKKINESTKNVETDLDISKDFLKWEKIELQYSGSVQCGVCKVEVDGEQWLQHIQKEHNYIAWIEGAQPLNFEMEEDAWQYLNIVKKNIGALICGKCGLNRKYGKSYLQHVKECDGSMATMVDQLNDSQMIENNINSTYVQDCTNSSDKVTCGVCGEEVAGGLWLQHIQKAHGYLAWAEGRPPLNVEDKELINTYLKLLIKRIGVLTCGKCGVVRKLAKTYLQHVSKCEAKDASGCRENVKELENEFVHTAPVRCGVCFQHVEGRQWIVHIRLKHDYLARVAGKPPLDVNDKDQVRKHLSALKNYVDQLICNNCGEGRKHVRAYLSHVQYCNGTEKSDSGSEDIDREEEPFVPRGTVQCGVCKREVDGEEWINHIHKEHDYMATIEGRSPLVLDDEVQVRTHLNNVRRFVRELVCNKCGESRKFVKSYMNHVKNCGVSERLSIESVVESRRDSVASAPTEEEKDFQFEFPGTVVCGVCDREVSGDQWIHHIRVEHKYIAHVKGKPPLDTNNMKQIRAHLNAISKHAGGLYCDKCGLMRLYVKSYLIHINQCGNNDKTIPVDRNDSEVKKELDESFTPNESNVSDISHNDTDASQFVYEGIVRCGVCHSEVEGKTWIEHIQKQHSYLAWIDGQAPLDLEDQEQVHAHLYELSRVQNGLTCNICDAKRKYVKSFLDHIRNCNLSVSAVSKGTLVECAVCSEKMLVERWKNHAMKNHYNIAWTVGSDPIDLKNPYAVEKYLKDYKKIQKSLICKICKLTRVSCAGFYAHIITCGKTEEEIEDFKSVCDICNSKYLCIYKNQHLAFHREQEYVKEKKSRALELAQSKAEEGGTPGRRRAAEKAKTVIEDYKSSLNKFNHKCASCSFGTDVEEELEAHTCAAADRLSDSDASASVQLDAHSDDTDTDIDSNVSMDEEEQQAIDKKKRVDTPAKVSHHIPFKINSASHYVSQAALDFYNIHYTLDELFPDWKPREYQEVDEENLSKYLPTVQESCKVKIGHGEWTTYKRFEAKNDTENVCVVLSIFVGGSIRCVSWAGGDGAGYLAVAGHGAPDAPRLPAHQLREHPALVQLWDFGHFDSLPKFVLGLALDYGTVWAMSWCPSGARDPPPTSEEAHAGLARLGLLALACSNGSAYILPVPYPNPKTKKPQIIKIKPSVELRLSSSADRRKYQATAISWSKQKGHTIILVGYADGSTAFYDLDCDSPLLKSVENNVTILYPFQDDRPHNTCISEVDMFASGDTAGGRGAWGAWGGASCTGVLAALRAPAPRLHAPLATAAALFTPHWPSLLLTADEAIANYMTNEVEWHGGGRRLGGQRALATCARCGDAAALTPPALRLMRTHPAYKDPRRDVVGILRMAPLGKKRRKHTNDELSMKVEPLAYEDAVQEYGIEFKLKSHMNKADQQVVVSEAKAQFPERFPLAEVPALAFCPARAAHSRLALPTHSGLLFIVNMRYYS